MTRSPDARSPSFRASSTKNSFDTQLNLIGEHDNLLSPRKDSELPRISVHAGYVCGE
jgi:hypothetical protein